MSNGTPVADIEVRDAVQGDLDAIRQILNNEIAGSTATWTTKAKTRDAMHAWYESRREGGFPVLVAIREGSVAGYASYGPFRSGEGYARTVEHSIYVGSNGRGGGVGKALLAALIARAQDEGYRLIVGGVSGEAEGSLAFHRAMGFEVVGRIPGAGEKFGRRLDLVFVALAIGRD